VIDYDRDALAEAAPRVITLADAEDLAGHGDAVRIRLEP
jgi:histidinol dehydrogenase